MNDEQFEESLQVLEQAMWPSTAEKLRSRDTAQREALARVEAENEKLARKVLEIAGQRDIAQAQLAEAVGLLKFLEDEFQGFGSATRKISTFLARHAQAEQQEVCWQCGDTGEVDTGGVMPWGAPAMAKCPCQREDQAEQQDAQSPMAKMAEGLRQKAADEWADHPSNPANQEAKGAQAGDERAAFRKEYDAFRQWAGSRLTARQLDLDEVGLFYDEVAGFAHDAWQARAALATQPDARGAEHE